MSRKTAYVVSLKFAPGLKKEFLVFGENIRKNGFNVKYILSKKYSNIEGNFQGVEYITTSHNIKSIILDTIRLNINRHLVSKSFLIDSPAVICFYNPHPYNPTVARLLKEKYPKVINLLYLHDPYKHDKTHYGLAKATYISFVERIQKKTIQYMDYVVSPSKYSSQLLMSYYPEFKGKNYIAPLLVPDQNKDLPIERKYFSIVGGAHQATGHDTFIELVNYVAEKAIEFNFGLISSSDIQVYLNNLTNKGRVILKIVNKEVIKDSEINGLVSSSYAVFRLDKEVTQSGVIPVCYMNGTPVIARDIPGLRQHVKHKVNGYLIPFDCTPDNLLEAMSFVQNNFNELSMNARQSYEEVWAEWNWDKYYGWLINLLKSKKGMRDVKV